MVCIGRNWGIPVNLIVIAKVPESFQSLPGELLGGEWQGEGERFLKRSFR